MHLSFWQIDTLPCADWRVRISGPHATFAFQDEEHFFVVVKMIGRAAGRDRADELRDLGAADFVVDQHSVPAIGGWLGGTICEANKRQSVGTSRIGCGFC